MRNIFLLNYTILKEKIQYKNFTTIFNKYCLFIKILFLSRFHIFYSIYFKKIIEKEKYNVWHFHSLNYKTLLFINVLSKLKQKIAVTFQGADIQIQKILVMDIG